MPPSASPITRNLAAIRAAITGGTGMEVVIVSTSSPAQQAYWQARLEATRGQVCRADALIYVVCEDWPGGAGNGLGTLYALQQAQARAASAGIDLLARLDAGAAIGLYHTAGQGTRLAPLPGSETNNKPAVKLPGLLSVGGQQVQLTILEAVIQQTAVYAASRRGRVSVFWGDQIFVPSKAVAYTPGYHADILAKLGPMPDATQWQERGMERYGLIAVAADGAARQVEKIDHATALRLMRANQLYTEGGVGVSLGSFSMSAPLTRLLLAEFAPELAARTGKLDTDPHFWMPLTLDLDIYAEIMARKGVDRSVAAPHHARMQALRQRLLAADARLGLFGAVDVGYDSYWWDYGTVYAYLSNLLLLTGTSPEAAAARKFFGLKTRRANNQLGAKAKVDAHSIVRGCQINRGRITDSILINVVAEDIVVDRAILIGVAAPAISGTQCLLYKVLADHPLLLHVGSVRADAWLPTHGLVSMATALTRDGSKDWRERLDRNPFSYAELHEHSRAVDVTAAEAAFAAAYEAAAQAVRRSFPQ